MELGTPTIWLKDKSVMLAVMNRLERHLKPCERMFSRRSLGGKFCPVKMNIIGTLWWARYNAANQHHNRRALPFLRLGRTVGIVGKD